MTTNPHQSLRTFVNSIRSEITQDDTFGQHLNKLIQRGSRVGANGVFRRVRAIHEAVVACGGTLAEARIWTAQSLRWLQNGKAVDQKFAKYEFNSQCAPAMNALIKFVMGLPEDLLTPLRPPGSPFGSPFGPRLPGQSPFGTKPPAPTLVPTSPAPTPAAAPPPFPRPPVPPTPTFGSGRPPPPKPPPAVPFGKPPTPPARSGGLFGRPTPPAIPDLPTYIAACFDALTVTADVPTPALDAMDWLESLAKGTTVQDVVPAPEKPVEATLPTDLKGLYERLCVTSDPSASVDLLQRIGALNDLHAVELLYNLWRGTALEDQLSVKFAIMGGDVGVAGLMTLLPINVGQRPFFLGTLTGVVRRGNLSETSRAMIWQIAVAESKPDVVYCENALRLLAAIGTPEAQAILWEHESHPDIAHRIVALHALIECDPGDRLSELLKKYGEVILDELPDELSVGIPFDALETIVRHGRSPLALSALRLIGYKDDPRTVPLLIEQLSRRIPELRKAALAQLFRLKATAAADAVARLMEKDESLRLFASAALLSWDDPRCVPPLIGIIANFKEGTNVVDTIQKLDKFDHPAYKAWLLNGIDQLIDANEVDLESNLTGGIELLAELDSTCLQPLLARLIDFPSVRVRLAVIRALPKVPGDWASEALCKLIKDDAAIVTYRAAEQCKDAALGRELFASHNEQERVLSVRILWNAHDSAGLLDCLSDESAAVRDLAIVALGYLHAAESVEPLRRFLEQGDRLDLWTQNTAVLAWRSLAKMGVVAAAQPATTTTPTLA